MNQDSIDWRGGTVVYWVLDEVCIDRAADQQILELREDMAQVEYEDGKMLVDVGWYPSFCAKGQFVLLVIKSYDWEHPLLRLETAEIPDLPRLFESAVKFVGEALEK